MVRSRWAGSTGTLWMWCGFFCCPCSTWPDRATEKRGCDGKHCQAADLSARVRRLAGTDSGHAAFGVRRPGRLAYAGRPGHRGGQGAAGHSVFHARSTRREVGLGGGRERRVLARPSHFLDVDGLPEPIVVDLLIIADDLMRRRSRDIRAGSVSDGFLRLLA